MRNVDSVTGRPRKGRPLAFAFASGIVALIAEFIAAAAPVPLYNAYRAENGFTNAEISLTIVVYALSVLVALLVTGRLSNHLGRKPVTIASIILVIGACALFLGVHGIATLLTARALTGLGVGIASSNATAFIVDASAGRPTWLTTIASSQLPMLGLGTGAVLSGVLVEVGPAPQHFIYLLTGLFLVVSLILVILSPETVSRSAGAWRSMLPNVHLPAHARRILPVAAAILLATWATAAFYQAFVPAVVEDHLHTRSPFVIGLVFACFMAPSALGAPFGGRFSAAAAQRMGIIGFLIGMAGVAAAIAAGILWLFIAATVVAGASQGVAISAATRALLAGATAAERAPILRVVYLISYGAAALPSLIAGYLSETLSLVQIVGGYGALAAVAAVVTVIVARNPRPVDQRRTMVDN